MTAEEFISRLGPTAKPVRTPSGWTCRCPAHRDRTPSLSVASGRNGRILLRCFGGCSVESIVAAIGLKISDLMPSRREHMPDRPVFVESPETKRARWPKFDKPNRAELRCIGEFRN